jgi:hypothetical protein
MASTSLEKEKQLALEALKNPEKLVTEIERGNIILLIGIMSAAPHIANEIINLAH